MADSISWRLLFGFSALLTFAAAVLFYKHAAEYWTEAQEPRHLDLPGILLLLIGAVCIQAVLSRGEIDDWLGSPRIVSWLLIGIAANLLFALWQISPKKYGTASES